MKRIITSIIPLLLALSFVNAKVNDVLRQNEDDTMRCGIYAGNPMMYVDPTGMVIAIEDGGEIYSLSGNPGSYGFYCGEKRLNNDFANINSLVKSGGYT